MKKIFLTLVAALSLTAAHAVPAIPTPLTFTQSDGSTITVKLVGDERFSTYTTTDGLTLERSTTGDFYYKTAQAVSNIRAHNQGARTQAEVTFINANAAEMTVQSIAPANMGGKNKARKAPAMMATADVPQTGSPRIPIVLVNYSDFQMRTSSPATKFNAQFNTNSKSCLQYFKDQSQGQFTPQFDILGPVTLPNTRAYYGQRTSDNNDAHVGQMVADAVKLLPNVDWSQYDNNGDRKADVVIVLYAGPGEAQGATSNAIWPCQWYLSAAGYYGDGPGAVTMGSTTVDKFAVFCETAGSSDYSTTIDGIGTFCHEFSHCLGLPDFYETTYKYGYYGMGKWSVMCSGSYLGSNSNTPAGYTAYEKEFMGWMTIPTAVANTKYTLNPIGNANGNAVKIYNSQSSSEYYILENNPKTGWYAYQANSGLMVNHVTYSSSAWSGNTVNNTSTQRMTIIPADNTLSTSNESGDLYPYNGNNKLTDTSTPAATLNTGTTKFMGKPITEITKNSDGTVSFWFMKNYVKNVPTINTVNQADITISKFKVTWNEVENAATYTLNVTDGNGYNKTFEGLTDTECLVSDLSAGTTYTCKVKVIYTDDTESAWSATRTVTTKSNPVMAKAAEENIETDAFTASWNQNANVESYTLHLRRVGMENFTELLHETFSKCTTSAPSQNIASSISKYTDVSGWSAVRVYQEVGGLTLASNSGTGNITSPALDFSGYDGKVVVKITAATVSGGNNYSLTVSAGGASESIVITNENKAEHTIVLNTDRSTNGKVSFTAMAGKKVTIYDVQIFNGDADDVMTAGAPRKAPVVNGNQDEQTITGITGNSYTVTGLAAGAEYKYRVKAIFTNGSESGWSNVETVALKGTPSATGDVNGDGTLDVTDINCIVATLMGQSSQDYQGREDVNGDGTVDVTDINSLLSILLGL